MDDNIKDVLDELKKENENLKQKMAKIETDLNTPKQDSSVIMDNKFFDVGTKPIIVPPVDKNSRVADDIKINIKPLSGSKTSTDGWAIALIIIGILLFRSFFGIILGTVLIIIGISRLIAGGISTKGKSVDITNVDVPVTAQKDQSLELNLGIKWFKVIGIIALVVGVSYFVKYAIDLGWINHVTRVVLGFLLGFGLIIFGHIMRAKKDFKTWGETVIGGGIAICYFIGYIMYYAPAYRGILGITQVLDVFILVAISILAIGISLYENSQNLAAWSFGLAYLTFFLFGKEGIANMIYLAIISVSALILGLSKKWYFINFLGMIGSYICFTVNNSDRQIIDLSRVTNQIFLFSIFAIYNIQSLIWINRKQDKELLAFNNCNMIMNPVLFFLVGYFGNVFHGFYWVVLSLAIFYTIMILIINIWKKTIEPVYVCLATLFFALFIMMKLDYKLISTFWSLLFALLGIMYLATNIKIFKKIIPIFGIILFSKIILFDTWRFLFKDLHTFDLVTFIKYVVYFGSFAIVGYVLDRSQKEEDTEYDYPGAYYWTCFIIGGLAIFNLTNANWASVSWLFYAFLFLMFGFLFKKPWFRLQGVVLILLAILRIVFVDIAGLDVIYKTLVFITLGILLLTASFVYIKYQDKIKGLF